MVDLSKIETVFHMFHDGCIEGWSGDKQHLTLKVGCQYLSELIDKDFEYFWVEILDIHKIELAPWCDEKVVFTELSKIFENDLDILSPCIEDNCVVVGCQMYGNSSIYPGGNLFLSCESIIIYDQAKNELTMDFMTSICKKYWDNFGKRS